MTKRGVYRTYSDRVGSWMRYSWPFVVFTRSRTRLPMISVWGITPRCVSSIFIGWRGLERWPSCEVSSLSRTSAISPSAAGYQRGVGGLEDPGESCDVINAHTFEDSIIGGKLAKALVAESYWLSPAYLKGP